jgi:hypothetical protein
VDDSARSWTLSRRGQQRSDRHRRLDRARSFSEGRQRWTGTRLSAGSGREDDLRADASRSAMVRYPDTVTFAPLLADHHWSALASAGRLYVRQRARR